MLDLFDLHSAGCSVHSAVQRMAETEVAAVLYSARRITSTLSARNLRLCCRMSSASGSTGADEGSRSRKRRQQSAPAARVALFRHVRFNRVHVSITYKGTYFSLNNAKVSSAARISLMVATVSPFRVLCKCMVLE